MRLAVFGLGPVGLVTAACFARWGHTVVGVDVDAERVRLLHEGHLPFHEPRLPDLVAEGVDAGRLTFATDADTALVDVEAAFLCVGTPSGPDGAPNLTYVEAAGHAAARHAPGDLLLVEKSTVPAATAERLERTVALELRAAGRDDIRVEVASNPEFLREGAAVADSLRPDRIVLGAASDWALDVLREVYAPVIEATDCPVIETDRATAELIKHASNAFLATRLSFINAVSRVCDAVGADVRTVADGMGHDHRIGRAFLDAGLGYGGSCFPKDVDAFADLARKVGEPFPLLESVRDVNHGQRQRALQRLRDELWHLDGKRVALLGAAFKPGTDDLREAPAVWLAQRLLDEGAQVHVYDPVAIPAVKAALPAVAAFEDPLAACEDAHAAVVCTEWPEIVELAPEELAARLAWPVVYDGRNVLDPDAMTAAGLRYLGVGRRPRG